MAAAGKTRRACGGHHDNQHIKQKRRGFMSSIRALRHGALISASWQRAWATNARQYVARKRARASAQHQQRSDIMKLINGKYWRRVALFRNMRSAARCDVGAAP